MRMHKGLFITIEGVDGSGKSTQSQLLFETLSQRGLDVVRTREPGGSIGAEEIRRLVVEGDANRWSTTTELLLFNAARRDHVERVISPALERGAIVICDRYVDSTRAYQAAQDPSQLALVNQLHQLIIGLDPDLTLLFRLPADQGLARGTARETQKAVKEDRFETKGLSFQERVAEGFAQIARTGQERVVSISAQGSVEEVASRVWDAVETHLP